MSYRTIKRRIKAMQSMDGAGVKIQRSVGQNQFARIDPFLMLDCFSSDDPDDYIAGFPAHPHRGFETVTYMLDGFMRHRDHMGNEGILKPGGVQWMTAGQGVIHEEMPEQDQGLMRGFQLWVNLPAKEKLKPAAYQNLEPEEIPELSYQDGVRLRLVAGSVEIDGEKVSGPVSGISRQPLFLEMIVTGSQQVDLPVPELLSGFVYLFEGGAELGDESLVLHEATELDAGDAIRIKTSDEGARLMVIAGVAIEEPIAQYGPFVMNTHEEIEQAIRDYQSNRLTG